MENPENLPTVLTGKFTLKRKDPDYTDPILCLEKGKYDINYVINICRVIEQKCEAMKLNPKDLSQTLQQSLKRLIAMLEVERNQKNKPEFILIKCDCCGTQYSIRFYEASYWKCIHCNEEKS